MKRLITIALLGLACSSAILHAETCSSLNRRDAKFISESVENIYSSYKSTVYNFFTLAGCTHVFPQNKEYPKLRNELIDVVETYWQATENILQERIEEWENAMCPLVKSHFRDVIVTLKQDRKDIDTQTHNFVEIMLKAHYDNSSKTYEKTQLGMICNMAATSTKNIQKQINSAKN